MRKAPTGFQVTQIDGLWVTLVASRDGAGLVDDVHVMRKADGKPVFRFSRSEAIDSIEMAQIAAELKRLQDENAGLRRQLAHAS